MKLIPIPKLNRIFHSGCNYSIMASRLGVRWFHGRKKMPLGWIISCRINNIVAPNRRISHYWNWIFTRQWVLLLPLKSKYSMTKPIPPVNSVDKTRRWPGHTAPIAHQSKTRGVRIPNMRLVTLTSARAKHNSADPLLVTHRSNLWFCL